MQSKPSKSKPRVIKDFFKLDEDLQTKVLQFYGLADVEDLAKKLQSYTEEAETLQNKIQSYSDPKTGLERFALPYETEDRFYMIRIDEFLNTQVEENQDSEEYSKSDEELLKIDKMDKPKDLDNEDEEEEDEKDDIISIDELEEDEDDEETENE